SAVLWLAVAFDHFSRRVMGFAIYHREPSSRAVLGFLEGAFRRIGEMPKRLVTDQGKQFTESALEPHSGFARPGLMRDRKMKTIDDREDLLGPGAGRDRLRQVDPAHRPGRVDQEFGGTGNVMTPRPGLLVDQIVRAKNPLRGIRKKREGVDLPAP